MRRRVETHRHLPFIVAACIGATALAVALFLHARIAYSLGANAFFATYLALVLNQMPQLTSDYLSRNASAADLPVHVIFVVTFLVVCVAVASLFQLINGKGDPHPMELLLSSMSLPLGWFTIHAMFALHYAHAYWMDDGMDDDGGDSREGSQQRSVPARGLLFPGEDKPEGWDFLYFSATIGMTSQTSDTGIASTRMRRIATVHSISSFFFNTVILAAAVNLAVSLGG
ncbi:MAG: DUF1345 domain-containing protein [Burkholderiaceae bacterium]|nr:DUF1345 domain-containing protein [Burkholderiaceae bacterium]